MPDLNSPDGPRGIYVLPEADVSQVSRKALDVPYDLSSPFQKLDLYLPEPGSGPWPTLVFVHGGAWRMCDKADLQLEGALRGLGRGYAVVSVNYRLTSEVVYPHPVHDVQRALEWVKVQGPWYGLDPNRIVLWGESAGAHLAAHAALRDETQPRVKAAALLFCPTNFLRMDPYLRESGYPTPDHELPQSPESKLLGAPVATVPDKVHDANPETWIRPGAPAVLLQHGTQDDVVPWQLSREFSQRLEATNPGRVELDFLPGAGHAGPEFHTPGNVDRIFTFFDRWIS